MSYRYDTLIRQATVFTGRNTPRQILDVAINGTRIAAIAPHIPAEEARHVLDAQGLYLTPGFIDPHASTGFGYFFPQAADHKLFQGITTEIFGNCGTSTAPIGPHLESTMQSLAQQIGFPFEWRSLAEYFRAVENNLQFNIATLVGHSTLRGGYLEASTQPEAPELPAMQIALAQAIDEGALGLSTGLIYAPGCFAQTDELVALVKTVAQKGGIYASHIRNEREKLEEAVEEALHIARSAGTNVLVSHLKAAEKPNWGKIPGIIERLKAYNTEGPNRAAVDVYPYDAVSTKLRAFIPKEWLEQGLEALPAQMQTQTAVDSIQAWVEHRDYDLDKMMVISNEIEAYCGKMIHEIAETLALSYGETIAQILAENPDTWVVYHCINPEDMDAAILWEKAMICTDSWSYPINAPKTIGQPHPRSYGAFTTYLERYVLQNNWLSWEEAIHKVTELPATFFGLPERGLIEEGYFADLVLFDPNKVKANATYLTPKRLSEGVEYLWVNGTCTIREGELEATACSGQIIGHTATETPK